MSHRERKRSTIAGDLAALLAAGDNRAAAATANQVLSQGGSAEDEVAARAALARVKPERAATLLVALCFVLVILAAALGLRA